MKNQISKYPDKKYEEDLSFLNNEQITTLLYKGVSIFKYFHENNAYHLKISPKMIFLKGNHIFKFYFSIETLDGQFAKKFL